MLECQSKFQSRPLPHARRRRALGPRYDALSYTGVCSRGRGADDNTVACTRPPTRCLSCTFRGSGRRVMHGVRLQLSLIQSDSDLRLL